MIPWIACQQTLALVRPLRSTNAKIWKACRLWVAQAFDGAVGTHIFNYNRFIDSAPYFFEKVKIIYLNKIIDFE
jgi:hypothetical protein